MANARDQAKRDQQIRTAHAAGDSVRALAQRFELSESRIKQVLRMSNEVIPGDGRAMRLAETRRAEYTAVVGELKAVAAAVPATQPAAKVGAYRVLLDSLDRLTTLERALGLLPDDLAQLGDQRQLAETVLAVFIEYNVHDDARRALVQRLGVEGGGP